VTDESKSITDLRSGERLTGSNSQKNKIYGRNEEVATRYQVTIPPHSFRGFAILK
jgi:hypothetical protein